MPPFAAAPTAAASPGQVLIAAGLAAAAFYWLLPRPRGRSVALGTFTALLYRAPHDRPARAAP